MTSLSFIYNPISTIYYLFSIRYIRLLPLSLYFLLSQKLFILHWHLLTIHTTSISFPLIFDAVGTLTATTVLFISANVIKFANIYIKLDQFIPRFTHLISIFVLSITLLVFLPRLPTILLGWDGLGLTRFLLVVYYQNAKSLRGGIITALTNRLGDATILIAIALILNTNQWFYSHLWENKFLIIIRSLILIARLTKSAQIPFSSWLPAAIAAPTPVSALVHSSTLVTAGIFLQIRFSDFIFCNEKINFLVLFISAITILIAGLRATIEYDIKKIIALSTLSQLRIIITSLAINFPLIALFHLITHAIFKALIFICAGTFINIHAHNQDIRLIINLRKQIPLTTSCFLVANLSLCAIPFIAGFYSKDLIIELLLASPLNFISFFIILIAIGITTAYALRLLILSSWKSTSRTPINKIFDISLSINQPTLTLTLGAILSGATLNWLIFPNAIPTNLTLFIKLITILIIFISFSVTWIIRISISSLLPINIPSFILSEITRSIWFLTPLSSQFIIHYTNKGYFILKVIDNGWLESFSAQGIHQTLLFYSKTLQPFQANIINVYLHLSLLVFIPIIFFI